MATVSLEKVSKVYPNGLPAVSDLDLDVAEGELMVLVGDVYKRQEDSCSMALVAMARRRINGAHHERPRAPGSWASAPLATRR